MSRRTRWETIFYLLVIAAGMASAPFTKSAGVLRFGLVVGWAACGGWHLLWRAERSHRERAELRLSQDTQRCAVCHHYACDGDLCSSCEGPCATVDELLKRHVQPELNGHGGI